MAARRLTLLILATLAVGAPGAPGDLRAAPAGTHDLANGCLAAASVAGGEFIAIAGPGGYRADEPRRARAARFHLKPTGLGTFLLHDEDQGLLAIDGAGGVARAVAPGPPAEWALRRSRGAFAIRSTANGRQLAADRATGELSLTTRGAAGRNGLFELLPARGCDRFPEAGAGASGRPRAATNPDGTVFGFADIHVHVTADLRAGGRVVHGESFNRFGIAHALGGDERDHGPDGSLDVTGNLLRTGLPVGTHDTQGWPSFSGWPVHDTYTHQQIYYAWLKRAWKAGMRLAVAQTIEDEPLCRLQPLRSHSCDEMATIGLEVQRLRALQDYVDAQSGGPGRGWFRLVYNPTRARRVIEHGKLAVVIGVEASNPLGCSEFLGAPQCTAADIDRGLDELHRLGVRSLFATHWVDNAFGGVALQSGANGLFIGAMQLTQTGLPFTTEPCVEGDEADGRCNTKGLTGLGAHLIRGLMSRHMLIEIDHLSQKARRSALAIAAEKRYPVVSSHTHTGGEWTPEQLHRLYRLGGLASATPDAAPELAAKIVALRRHRSRRRDFAVALGTDTGGFSALPGPRPDASANPLPYPFRSYGGGVRFTRQRTGGRVFDLNTDGVAHYGLFADLLADVQRQELGEAAMRPLFRSAEAYLQMWERAIRRG